MKTFKLIILITKILLSINLSSQNINNTYYDFIWEASRARWETATINKNSNSLPSTRKKLRFQVPLGRAGVVKKQTSVLEDNSYQEVLHTHPKWTKNGTIKGWFPKIERLPYFTRVRGKIGFIKPKGTPKTDGARFMIYIHYFKKGKEYWKKIYDKYKRYNGRLDEFDISLKEFYNQKVFFELRVDTGNTSDQDWAAWINPRIDIRIPKKIINENYSTNAQALSIANNSKWSSNTICVCWENPSANNSLERDWVKNAIENSWEAESDVNFYGWRDCKNNPGEIRILIADEGPKVLNVGRFIKNKENGMVLNFQFRNWGTSCQSSSTREDCIRTIAIHEFGHALGFTHEHNRQDCGFRDCSDAPQGTNGVWNITDCDDESIMNYCFNSSYNGGLSRMDIQGLRAVYGFSGDNNNEIRTFRPQPIKNICPIGSTNGDLEFGGNGPRINCSVTFQISEDQRHLEALIEFHALETGGDRSETSAIWVKRLWTAEPSKKITSINSDIFSSVSFKSRKSGPHFLGCGDGELHIPPIDGGRAVRKIEIFGDTSQNDISADSDCGCDTKIKIIEFNEVNLTLENR